MFGRAKLSGWVAVLKYYKIYDVNISPVKMAM